MNASKTIALEADIRSLIEQHGIRSVMAGLSGVIYDMHLQAKDDPVKWMYRSWATRLESMAEDTPKSKSEEN